ncbi:MAG: BsaWI family type II restriction enzyme, partial [bacterium]
EIRRDLAQSWKRTSGWALERIFVKHYCDHLRKHHILMDIFADSEKRQLLKAMKLNYAVESAKADVLLVNTASSKKECFGVVHVKASIAERRQNDQNFSKALMDKNYFSPFMTMDCKSFPSEQPLNKGEFGEPLTKGKDSRTDKRKEFEEEGYFSACFSYNKSTKPTSRGQKAAARIYQMNFSDPDDDFSRLVIAARNRLYEN